MLADQPDPDRLDAFLDLLVLSTADQVRISTTYDMPAKAETVERIEGYIAENGLPLGTSVTAGGCRPTPIPTPP